MENNTQKMPVMIFDYGCVLLDWNPHYLFRHFLGEDPQATLDFIRETDFFAWNVENDRGMPFAENAARLIARFPQYEALIWAYHERFSETVGGAIQPTVDILYELKAAGHPIWGLSNWPADKFAEIRPRFPFFSDFDGMVISGEVGLVKPEKPIFDYLLAQVGRPAADCLFIDDNPPNITAARGFGFQTIRFTSADDLREELNALGILS